MSSIGRIFFGKLCDLKCLNRLYIYQFSIFAIGVCTMLCPLAESYSALTAYALIFGFFDGCFVGQVAVITADVVGHEKLSQAVGNMFGALALPMSFGPPVAGKRSKVFCRYYFCNRPFAAGGHMVQNPKYWRAKECDKTPLGNVNKEKSHFSGFKNCVLFWSTSLSHSFVLQYFGFCTMWPPAAKGLFGIEKLCNIIDRDRMAAKRHWGTYDGLFFKSIVWIDSSQC